MNGVKSTGTGLYVLDKATDVSIIAIPGQGDVATVNAGIDYCKNSRRCRTVSSSVTWAVSRM